MNNQTHHDHCQRQAICNNVRSKIRNHWSPTVTLRLRDFELASPVRSSVWINLGPERIVSIKPATIQIDHQPDATIFHFIILTFIYSSTCFWCSPAHHQELNDCSSSLWLLLLLQSSSSWWWAGERPKHVEL